MDSRANTRAFSIFLVVSLAVHAAVLAVTRLSPPARDAEPAFTVEILPLQPVVAAQAPVSAAVAPAPSRAEPKPTPAPVREAPTPQRVAPADRVPEPAPVNLARAESAAPAAAPEGSRAIEKDGATAMPERKAEPAQAAALPVVTRDAAYLRNSLEYPLVSRRNGEQGTVLVKVLVARDGSVLSAELEKSSGSPNLDTAAVRSVRKWHFTPARRGDELIEKEYIVPAVFKLENARR